MGNVYILLLVMVFGSFTFADTATLTGRCTEEKIDIGFLVDSSGTVKKQFDRELEIVKEIVKAFNIRTGFNRAGLVSFSNEATTDILRQEGDDITYFNKKVSALKFKGNNTYIDRALTKTTNELFNLGYDTKEKRRKILFVLTDGQQTEENKREVDLKSFTRTLKTYRVTIIAIAMGPNPDRKYLLQLVDDPEKDIVPSRSHTHSLQTTVQKAIDTACRVRPRPSPKCDQKIDFGFLLDASGSIGNKSWPKETDFVIEVLKRFKSSNLRDDDRAGVIIYSNDAELFIELGEHDTRDEFEDKLKSFAYVKWQRTNIYKALVKAKTELFNEKRGDRPKVQNVLILVTDGEQTVPVRAGDSIKTQAQELREKGVITIAVGVGKVDRDEMLNIAGNKRRYFPIDSIEKLSDAVSKITVEICESCEVNVGFVLDSSRTTARHYDHGKKIVKYLAAHLKLGTSGTKASVTSFSLESKVNIGFDEDQDDYESFAIRVGFLRNLKGRTNIEKGLLAAEKEFEHPKTKFKLDEKLKKVIVVLSDGRENEGSVAGTAKRLRDKGFHIVAVSLGNPSEVLKAITGDENYIFDLGHYTKETAFNEKI